MRVSSKTCRHSVSCASSGRAGASAPRDAQPRLCPSRRDPPGQRTGKKLVFHRVTHQHQRRVVEAPAPEVAHCSERQLLVVGAHFESEREAALEGEVAEHPLAEAVDGVHARAIDVLERGVEAPCGDLEIGSGRPRPVFHQLPGLGLAFEDPLLHFGPQRIPRALQGAPDAFSQLRGGGAGEGDDEDFVDFPSFFDHETGDQGRQGVGLPGARARFHEHRAGLVQRETQRK